MTGKGSNKGTVEKNKGIMRRNEEKTVYERTGIRGTVYRRGDAGLHRIGMCSAGNRQGISFSVR